MTAANYPKIQLVQILHMHKLLITGKPISTNSIHYPPLSLLATVSTPAGQHSFVNGQQGYWMRFCSSTMLKFCRTREKLLRQSP